LTSFFGELRRRNVVKVAVAYAIVGWVLIEVSATVLPIFEAPDWIVQVFTFFVILGFPLALILSWAYEITPEGVKLERNVAAGESITHVTGRKLDFAIIGALVLALGFVVYNYVLEDTDGRLPNSVAVLPFENMSVDPEEAFYASGIHEEILNQLVKLSALNVIARTSMQQYANTEKTIPEIARELNVETVMEGSVRYAGGQIRITAQLNDGITGAHLWSETYTRDFEDIFAIESDVAMSVANAVGAEFSLAEQARLEKIPTDSLEAYRLYLLANQTGGSLRREYLDQAIQADPNFAQAYVRRALHNVNELRFDRREENYAGRRAVLEARVLQDLDRARMLDSNLGSGYSILGLMHSLNWRGIEARDAFQRSYELSPNNAGALVLYADFLSWTGQHERALELAQRALELDPATSQSALGEIFEYAKDRDSAYAAWKKRLEVAPGDARALSHLGILEIVFDYRVEAEKTLRLAELAGGDSPIYLPTVIYGYGRLGLHEDVERLGTHFERMTADQRLGAGQKAFSSLARGDLEEAFSLLKAAAEDKEPYDSNVILMRFKLNVFDDPILEHSEFVEIREKLGFTDL